MDILSSILLTFKLIRRGLVAHASSRVTRTYCTHFGILECLKGVRLAGGTIRNAQPNQLCLHTYDTIPPTIYHVLFIDSDSLVTT